ncbi:hypothetical protein ACOME3_009742 [Neoechinorhynchus agilis]
MSSVLTRDFDNCVRSTLPEVLKLRLSNTAWKQAMLPIRFSGLGIQSATKVAIAALLSSISTSSDLVLRIIPPHTRFESHSPPELIEAHVQWKSVFGQVVPTETNSQKRWTRPISSFSTHAHLPLVELVTWKDAEIYHRRHALQQLPDATNQRGEEAAEQS